jgi:hypothetical protein
VGRGNRPWLHACFVLSQDHLQAVNISASRHKASQKIDKKSAIHRRSDGQVLTRCSCASPILMGDVKAEKRDHSRVIDNISFAEQSSGG